MNDWKAALLGVKEQREEQAEQIAERVLQKMLDDGAQKIHYDVFAAKVRAEAGELGTTHIVSSVLKKFVDAGKLQYIYEKDPFGVEYGEYRAV